MQLALHIADMKKLLDNDIKRTPTTIGDWLPSEFGVDGLRTSKAY
jgi:hypothetical protein